jgi:hypothetical protein
MWGLWVSLSASAQDSGADLLDVARRAAVVDQVLADHAAWMSQSRVFGVDQRVRVATDLSMYLVSDLALTTEAEGTFPVELSRSFSGFQVEVLGPPGEDGTPGEQVFWLGGGGLAYGLSRPYLLPLPAVATGTGTAAPTEPASLGDLEGEQYSDEQYTVGGRWRGFSLAGAWARGQVLSATDDGRADVSTLEQRLNRGQLTFDSPVGLSLSTRWAFGGALENVAVDLRVNEALERVSPAAVPRKAPQLALAFRKSDYGADDARSHPRVLGAGVSQDFAAALFAGRSVDQPALTAKARAQLDLDVVSPAVQLGLAEAEVGWSGRLLIGAHGGGSWYHDDALTAVVGTSGVAGTSAGGHLGWSTRSAPCERGSGAPGAVCVPNFGLRGVLKFDYRQSWAEELRYVAEYAGKPQTFVYVELLGGA